MTPRCHAHKILVILYHVLKDKKSYTVNHGINWEKDDGQRELADLAGDARGQVTLASMNVYLLPGLLQAFRERHPDITLRLFGHPRQETLAQLERGEKAPHSFI